jgi:hypothetical protein
MLVQQVALTTESKDIGIELPELMRVSAALQKQMARDFAPIWDVNATVDAFAVLDDVPLGYWPIILVEDVPNAAGIHLDKEGQPFALVEVGSSWSLTAGHELLEMMADPFGNRLMAGPSPKAGQGRVEFLVEICDPSEDEAFAYTVNGVLVSDFYTPHYFDPKKAANVRYSFTGSISEPRQVLRGGYLSWHDPVTDHWFQKTFFGTKPAFRDLGRLSRDGGSLRSMIDALTPQTRALSKLPANASMMMAAVEATGSAHEPMISKANSWREQITQLKAET